MHRYQFKRTIVLRQELRQTIEVEAESETRRAPSPPSATSKPTTTRLSGSPSRT